MSTEELSFDYLIEFSNNIRFEKIMLILLAIAILIIVSKSITLFFTRLYQRLPNKKTLILKISTIFTFFLNIGGSIYIFYSVLQPPTELLIAFLGSATFAVGFALKDLVASIISGITIIIDPPFQVGDRIQFKDIYGEIKHIGLRAVRVRNLDNQIITIPNLSFVTDAVLCANPGKLNKNVIIDFYFKSDSNIKEAKRILYELAATNRYTYLNEAITMVVDNCWKQDIFCLKLTLKAHVIDARFEKAFQTDLITKIAEIMPQKF